MNTISISIIVSDPWDVGEAVSWQPIKGQLLKMETDEHGGKALIKFNAPVSYRGVSYCYAVASPRLEGHHMAEIQAGKMVCSALTGIADQQAKSSNPMDISNWRGGLAFIGDVELTDKRLHISRY